MIESLLLHVVGLALAPLMLGVINRTKAVFAGRHGQPLLQPYYDLGKLVRKGAVYSTTTTWVFRAGPIIGLAAVLVAALLVPLGRVAAPLAFAGDVIVFAGVLGLMRFVTVLAALDTGSAFEGMGASREVTFSALAEPALFLGLLVLTIVTGSLSLSGMVGAVELSDWLSAGGMALGLSAVALFLVLLAENARVPVDDPNTHLELTMVHEVMVLDHSGPDFAYILYGAAVKLWLFAALVAGFVLPFDSGNPYVNGAMVFGGAFAVAVIVGVVESTMARLRMTRVPHLLMGATGLAALGAALALVVG